MKSLPDVTDDLYIVLVKLNSPYNVFGDVDFAFVAYPQYRPRGVNTLEKQMTPYIVHGFRNPNGEMVGHVLSYRQVKDSLNKLFCSNFYHIEKFIWGKDDKEIIHCYVSWECCGYCCDGMFTAPNDDGAGMFYKSTSILVGIALTRAPKKWDNVVPLMAFVDRTWDQMMENLWKYQKDEFDDYPEFGNGTELFSKNEF